MKLRERIRRRIVRPNRIYIMPTGRGVLFLTTVIILILTAATYNNNLIFMLAFFLFAIFFISMIQTHSNLKGVKLHFVSADENFEGEKITLLFHLTQKRRRLNPALVVRSLTRQWKTLTPGFETLVPGEAYHPVRLILEAWRRGLHEVPEVALETLYPLGLFRAWKVIRSKGELLVYPKPTGQRPIAPTNFAYGDEELGLRTSPEGDFGELKAYREGESYHQIAWKHYARTGILLSKVHWGEEHKHYHIPWQPNGAPTESYLRQMSSWVQLALEEDASFTMDLPHARIDVGSGNVQAQTCWRALARFKATA